MSGSTESSIVVVSSTVAPAATLSLVGGTGGASLLGSGVLKASCSLIELPFNLTAFRRA